jgi:hypothetical protein
MKDEDSDRIEERLSKQILDIGSRVLELDGAIAELRASVNVLKMFVAAQINPDDVSQALKEIRQWESRSSDPDAQDRDKLRELIAALRHSKKKRGDFDS